MEFCISHWCIFTLLVTVLHEVHGGKILLVPIPSGSHAINFQQIGELLIEAGHDVHVVTDFECKSTHNFIAAGFTIKPYTPTDGCILGSPKRLKKFTKVLTEEPYILQMWSRIKEMNDLGGKFTEAIFTNDTLFEDLKSETYDLCIVDGLLYLRYLYVIPYKLDIPIISFLSVFNPVDASIPALPSFTPIIGEGTYTDEMNFPERLYNTFKMFLMDSLISLCIPSIWDSVVSECVPERHYKPLTEIVRSSDLWLIQNDIAIDYPQVRLPNVIDIGGINTGPGTALSGRLMNIADTASEGLIIMSFGTLVSNLAGDTSKRILDDLRKLKQTVIWNHNGEGVQEVPPNVHLIDWIPQNDLLAHPNTKVFVTHCGVNGQFEALYHGVPMLGFPLFADQHYNAMRISKHGIGKHLDFHFKPGDLLLHIEDLIYNKTFREAISHHSKIFRDRPMTPKQILVFWVEHLLKYGSKHLKSTGITLPWHKYWCIDIVSTCVLTSFIMIIIIWKTTSLCLSELCGTKGKLLKAE